MISGLYDLPKFANEARSAISLSVVESMKAETGGTEDALKARSLLYVAQNLKATTLIINGAHDDRTDPDQARRLAEVINAHGGHARAIVYPEYGPQIPVEVRHKDVSRFFMVRSSRPQPRT